MKTIVLVLAGVGLTLLSACYSVRRAEPLVGPMVTTDASIRRGEKLYNEHCYRCHTAGEGGLGPSLNDKPLPRMAMRFQIRHGLGTMPAFDKSQLSEQEVEDIADYVVALRRHGVKN